MKEFADGLWVYLDAGIWYSDIVLQNASTGGYAYCDHRLELAIEHFWNQSHLDLFNTEEYLSQADHASHLSPINLLVW